MTIGVLTRVEVFTRPGQKGTLRIRVMDELTQVAPSRTPGYIAGNGETHVWTGRYPLRRVKEQLKVWAWNVSTSKTHGCHIGFTVLEPEDVSPWAVVKDLVDLIKTMLGV